MAIMDMRLLIFLLILVKSKTIVVAAAEADVELSYVLETFEHPTKFAEKGAAVAVVLNETAFVGTGFLRVTNGALPWSIREHLGNTTSQAHLCHGATRLTLAYRQHHTDAESLSGKLSVQIALDDSSACETIVSEDCLVTYTSNFMELGTSNKNRSTDDVDNGNGHWHEVSWSLSNDDDDWLPSSSATTIENLRYIHGWEVRVVVAEHKEDTADIAAIIAATLGNQQFSLDLDHLACFGGPELFRALTKINMTVFPKYPKRYNNWLYMTHESKLASNETIISLDSDGVMGIDYTVEKTETWGGFTAAGCMLPGYFNLSSATAVSFDYIVHAAADPPDLVVLRLILDEQFQEIEGCDLDQTNERFYSFHNVLNDKLPNEDNPLRTITLPLKGGPDATEKFWFTGWSAAVDDRVLNKSRVKSITWEFAIDGGPDMGTKASGRIEILNLRIESNTYVLQDGNVICEDELGLTLTNEGFSQSTYKFGVSDCCYECERDGECLFALQSERKHCGIVSEITPRMGMELRLAPTSNEEIEVSSDRSFISWMNTVERTGDFCDLCDCVEKDLLIDCRGKNLRTVPQSFHQLWLPRVLDLRKNSNLALIGNRALSSISESLEEIHFPAHLRYLSASAIPSSGKLNLVDFEASDVLNVMDASGMFGDICCVEGPKLSLAENRSLTFCDHEGAQYIGCDALYLPFQEFTNYFVIDELVKSSAFMGQAAETPQMCAEYCKINPQCFYFQHDARQSRSEHACFHFSLASNLTRTDELENPDLQTPGIVAGVAPRARGVFENARLFVLQSELHAEKANDYTVSYQVKLGSTPQRGVVWVEPFFPGNVGFNVSISPQKVSLRSSEEIATFTLKVEDIFAAGNSKRALALMNNITTCDTAFLLEFHPQDELLVRLTLTIDNPTSSKTWIIAAALVMTATAGAIWYFAARNLEDQSWKVDVDELTFSTPPVVLGRGTFGLVVQAEWRGTDVAVKRVLPAEENDNDPTSFPSRSKSSGNVEMGKNAVIRMLLSDGNSLPLGKSPVMSFSDTSSAYMVKTTSTGVPDSGTMRSGSAAGVKGRNLMKLRSDFIDEMRLVSRLRHPNITTGAVVKGPDPLLIMELMDHGSLYDMVHNESMPIDGDLILPILRDIAQGMRFLHVNNPPIIHGDLKSANCLVDSHFRAKVSDFGLTAKQTLGVTGTPYWMDPVLLRGEARNSRETDVYSFGIMLFELYARAEPYDGEPFETVLKEVCDPTINKRPPVPLDTPAAIASLMQECHSSTHNGRPSFEEIDKRLRRIDAEQVEPGESRFSSQRKKSARNEDLLNKVFPKHVADALRAGRSVEPDRKDLVTIFFSDIVGFTDISSQLSAEKVTDMLDRLYNKLDALADKHNVFKIDVIGDAYMCATNLVTDQSTDHVKRIAEFSIEAIAKASETLIDDDEPSLGYIQIRCGFHSGPVVAQVVGRSSPKYSVFGDAVNTASRMESSSLVGHIQCSRRSAELLASQDPNIPLRSRGLISIKGKGRMETYFVNMSPCELESESVATRPAAPSRQTSLHDVMASLQGFKSQRQIATAGTSQNMRTASSKSLTKIA